MTARHPVVITGLSVGHLAQARGRLRFTAANPRLTELDGAVFDNAEAARRLLEAALAAEDDTSAGLDFGDNLAGRALRALLRCEPNLMAWG